MNDKRHWNLQLFAEDAGSDSGTAGNEQKDSTAADQQNESTKKQDGSKELKYTDKDLDDIIGKRFAKWQAQQQKAVDEAKKLAAMDAQQKVEYERDQLQKQLDELKKQASLTEMTKTARKMLSEGGITVPDELLAMMVSEDAESTKAAVDGFKEAFTNAVERAVKERLKGEPPRKGSGGAPAMTKEQIMQIRDPELRQKKMLENKHLFHF
ncbi:MAG: DUF4355 domain-containing protein [Butyricicoccus sp.]